ncbi:hypothetical protein A8H36_19075 [Burkholderia thailandensis]|nr:hypothetical protein A8H36_19075 [Burkholderia thailandensis]
MAGRTAARDHALGDGRKSGVQRGHAGRSSHEPDEAGKLESWGRPCRRTNGASLVEKLHTRNLAAQQNNR